MCILHDACISGYVYVSMYGQVGMYMHVHDVSMNIWVCKYKKIECVYVFMSIVLL